MEAGAAGGCGHGAAEAQLAQVQARDKCIDDANQRIWRDIVVNARRKQTHLTAICSLDEAHEHLVRSLLTWCRF